MERLQAAIEKARAQRNESGRPAPAAPRTNGTSALATEPGYADRASLDANWQSFRQIDTTVPAFRDKKIAAFAGGAEAAAFDMLRTRVIQQARSNNWRRIAVVSPHSSCGKTTTVTNLAFSLGRNSDMRTLAIDFDLRRATLARMLNQKPDHTMADVIEGRVPFADHGLRYGNSVAFGLNAGPVQNSSELLQSNRTAAMLDEIDATFQPDIVLFDMPPLMATDDSLAFLKNVDCALLIVAAEETPMSQIDVAERQIAELTQVMGVVLNKCRLMGSAYGYEYNY